MRYAKLALFSFLLIGCTSHMWRHPEHNDQARFNRDAYECERDMRQSGYYGTGIVGAVNAQGFAERCMYARGYYKAPIESQRTSAAATAAPQHGPTPVATGAGQTARLAAEASPATRSEPIQTQQPVSPPASRYAQLYLVKGRIVSTPPQSFTAEFFINTGKAKVELSGRRVLQGEFEQFPFSDSLASKLSLVKPTTIKAISGADTKGLARFTDIGIELECAYTLVSSTGRGAGVCSDNQGNGYEMAF